MKLGNEHEPYFLHFHGLLRGDPQKQYLGEDLPALGGPEVGTAVVVQGADEKVPWTSERNVRAAAQEVGLALAMAMDSSQGSSDLLLGCKLEALQAKQILPFERDQ